MLILAVVIVLMLVAAVGAWFSGWLASGARARAVADVVAIAAAQAQRDGRPACPVAPLPFQVRDELVEVVPVGEDRID